MLHVLLVVNAGARLDPPDRAGLASLTAALLTEGTRTRSAEDISEAIDFIGASFGASADRDYALLTLRVLKKDLATGLEILTDVLQNPAFKPSEIERQREAALASIRAAQENPTYVAMRAFQETVFEGEPYGHIVSGTESSVPRITRQDIVRFYEAYYRPPRTTIVVVGDITTNEARAAFGGALPAWGGDEGPRFVYPEPPSNAVRKRVEINKNVTQAAVVIGHRGVRRSNPDYEALMVMNYVLGGGGFSSRLMERIRTQEGLVYSVSSDFSANEWRGAFRILLQTKNESVSRAMELVRQEVERIRSEPVTDEEIEEAKRYLTGSFPLRLDSIGEIAQFIAEVSFFGLGDDYAEQYLRKIAGVSKEDVLRVARQYIHPEDLIEVVVADLSAVGKQ
jgi:zinc protease